MSGSLLGVARQVCSLMNENRQEDAVQLLLERDMGNSREVQAIQDLFGPSARGLELIAKSLVRAEQYDAWMLTDQSWMLADDARARMAIERAFATYREEYPYAQAQQQPLHGEGEEERQEGEDPGEEGDQGAGPEEVLKEEPDA